MDTINHREWELQVSISHVDITLSGYSQFYIGKRIATAVVDFRIENDLHPLTDLKVVKLAVTSPHERFYVGFNAKKKTVDEKYTECLEYFINNLQTKQQ